jgi:hypothetical protein
MGVIDKWCFEARGGHGCSNSDYRLHKTTCCGSYAVEDDELLELYIDPADLNKRVDLGYSPRDGEPPPRCPFCGAEKWDLIEIDAPSDVPEAWRWAVKCE